MNLLAKSLLPIAILWPAAAYSQASPIASGQFMASPSVGTGYLSPRAIVAADLTFPLKITIGSSPISGSCAIGYLLYNNSGVVGCEPAGSGGTGTVTSVGLTAPAWLTVTGSPITGSGTLAITSTSQSSNLFLASPSSGSGVMSPRAIVAGDIAGLSPSFVNLTLTGAQTITDGGSAGVGLLDIKDDGTVGATSTDFVFRAREFESFNIVSGTFTPFRFASQRNAGGIGNREAVIAGQFGQNALSTEFMTGLEGIAQMTVSGSPNSGIWTGLNGVCSIPAGADASAACIGEENDVFLASDVAKKVGVAAVDINSTGKGTLIDAAFHAYKGPTASGAIGFQHGLLFGDDVDASRFPIKAGGYAIRAAPSAVNLNAAIDFFGLSGTFAEDTIKLRAGNQAIGWWSGGAANGGRIASTTTSAGGTLFFTNGDTIIQSASGQNSLHVTGNGTESLRFINRTGVPTVTTCGTSPTIAGVNAGGTFTTGTGTPGSCSIVFATLQTVAGWPTNAWCTIFPANAAAAGIAGGWYVSAQSKTGFTLALNTGTDSAAFQYSCIGN